MKVKIKFKLKKIIIKKDVSLYIKIRQNVIGDINQ